MQLRLILGETCHCIPAAYSILHAGASAQDVLGSAGVWGGFAKEQYRQEWCHLDARLGSKALISVWLQGPLWQVRICESSSNGVQAKVSCNLVAHKHLVRSKGSWQAMAAQQQHSCVLQKCPPETGMGSPRQASPWYIQYCLIARPAELNPREGHLRLPEDSSEQGGLCHQAAMHPGLNRGHVRPLHRMPARGWPLPCCCASIGTANAHAAMSTMQTGR